MSYLLDLDDYDESQLVEELYLRTKRRKRGECDYCGRPFNSVPSCKATERHQGQTR